MYEPERRWVLLANAYATTDSLVFQVPQDAFVAVVDSQLTLCIYCTVRLGKPETN